MSIPQTLITGANAGIGYGICRRLLLMDLNADLIITCRNKQRAMDTLGRLQKEFGKSINVKFVCLDLGDMRSVEVAVREIRSLFPHLHTLIFNAGAGDFNGLSWGAAITALLSNPIHAITHSNYKIQKIGTRTMDGLGYVFQVNVFAHYYIQQRLIDIHKRVVWESSLEAYPSSFQINDIQGLQTPYPYGSSKRLMDMLHVSSKKDEYLCHPGVCATNIFRDHLSLPLVWVMVFLMYLVRWMGSPWHPVTAEKGASSIIFCALGKGDSSYKWGSGTTRMGREKIRKTVVEDCRMEESLEVRQKMDALYREWRDKLMNI
ncbi:3-keto-steroid reductase [Neolecta irregularis DAH-3]|uniref:3beta-hydroxysteroid 3-dehydrogenase n=1 Tax=Neolecta irregularis (strain DAH-3) TaxID=1198029 RepID=A0A1U7LPR4_NEOID|nr:3-keto-steroid reductase [Neolecta irregularis DAH-3]|eukprot:OLL24511.1 3-keto-steroid reductase [Neolecta irregularis DAH-3]